MYFGETHTHPYPHTGCKSEVGVSAWILQFESLCPRNHTQKKKAEIFRDPQKGSGLRAGKWVLTWAPCGAHTWLFHLAYSQNHQGLDILRLNET